MPGLLKFEHDCLTILRRSLIAVAPQEGCALLLGDEKQSLFGEHEPMLHVHLIWPCCNAWRPESKDFSNGLENFASTAPSNLSRDNRFALDPREQLAAQYWAREKNFKVLGVAHSHPSSEAIPSEIDIHGCSSVNLIVIVSKSEEVKAWFKKPGQRNSFYEMPLSS